MLDKFLSIPGGLSEWATRRASGFFREAGVYPYLTSLLVGAIPLVVGAVVAAFSPPVWLLAIGLGLVAVGGSVVAGSLLALFQLYHSYQLRTPAEHGIQEIFSDRHRHLPPEEWERLVLSARKSYKVLGLANHGYVNKQYKNTYKKIFRQALESNPDLRIDFLFLDPMWDEMVRAKDLEEDRDTRWDLVRAVITFATEIKGALREEDRPRMRLLKYQLIPTCGITWIDGESMIVTHYLSYKDNLEAAGFTLLNFRMPALLRGIGLIRSVESLYDVYRLNFEYVESKSSEITPDDVSEYKRIRKKIKEAEETIMSEEDRRG